MENQITIALTKGRIEKDMMRLLGKVGFDTTFMKDKGRSLIFESPDKKFHLLLIKASGMTTYVHHGVTNLGVARRNLLIEHPTDYLGMFGLNFGLCKFSVVSTDSYDSHDHKRERIVAKYPAITTDYFSKKGEDTGIISVQGSVEIASVIGLVDAIVNIVETGNTLVANGLKVYEGICRISARLIVSKVALKDNPGIMPFIRELEGIAGNEGVAFK